MKLTSKGFTLIEVMLGMTLLGIMMVLLFGTIGISARSWDAGETKIAEVGEAGTVYHFFQRYAATARPLWDDFTDPEHPKFSFQGQPHSMQFVTAFPASANRPGLQVFSLEWIREGGDKVLKVTLTPFFPVAENGEWQREEVVLLRGVREFSINYFEGGASTGPGLWRDEWVEREALPRLIRISIAREDEIFWPSMTIALKLSGQSEGRVDPGAFD